MYTVLAIFAHTAQTLAEARLMASSASHAFCIPVDIVDNTTGEVVARYEHGHRVD